MEYGELLENLKIYIAGAGVKLFDRIKPSQGNIMTNCPFHAKGQEQNPSFGVNIENGKCNCFTCGAKFDNFRGFCEKVFDIWQLKTLGKKWLKEYFDAELEQSERKFEIVLSGRGGGKQAQLSEAVNKALEAELPLYRFWHPYMEQRKITEAVANEFDIGFDKKTNCLTFPVWDLNGNLVFIARRGVKEKFFNYPSWVKKPVYLLNRFKDEKVVYVCESAINALTLLGWGYKAVALFGLGSLPQYWDLSKTNVRTYVLCFDGDLAGDGGAANFKANVFKKQICKIDLPRGKDANDLTMEEFDALAEKSYIL